VSSAHFLNDILYFIDGTVPDLQTIIDALPVSAQVRIIASTGDGVDQVLAALAGKHDVAALHLVSHGRPGAIVLGASVIDAATLAARPDAFVAIGQALAADADLLIYGCNVAAGESGKAFLAKLSDLTGASVAASATLTGAAHLGGDWALEIRQGSVQTPALSIPSYAGVLTAPTIGKISPIAYTENGSAQPLQGITFSGGSGYANGSITFGVTGSTSSDQLALFSDANSTAASAISVDSSGNVYLGNGTGRDVIGTVDTTNNGKNGQPLTIHLIGRSTGGLTNSSFEGSTAGWTIREERVILGTTKINGYKTPIDLTAPKNSMNGAGNGIDDGEVDRGDMDYDHQLATNQHTDGNYSLRLVLSGETGDGYDVVHGPYAYSNTFATQAGDVFTFDWRAAAGDDAFDAFGYLMNAETGDHVLVLDATGTSDTGETNWASRSVTVPTAGKWFFVFVGGTYDFTGGKVVGGSLYIDNFKVLRSSVNDTVLSNLAKHVQYENTSEAPPDAPRPLTIDVVDGAGDHQTGSTIIDIVPVNDAAVVTPATLTLTETDAVLTTGGKLTISDVDSPATFVAQTNKVGQYGAFSVGTDGTWSYVASSAHNAFKAGQVYTDTFEVMSADGTKATVTVKLTGTNDAPVVSGVVTGAATEDGTGVTLDALKNASDADAGAVLAVVDVSTLPPGVTYDAATHSFTLDPAHSAYQSLAEGKTQTVKVEYNVSDGTTSTAAFVSWTVTGANDAPTGGVSVAGTPTQGQVLTASNNVVDPDGIDKSTVAYQWQRQLPDGVWTNIVGATGVTFTPTQDDVNAGYVRAVLNYIDLGGTQGHVLGSALPIANVNDAPVALAISDQTATEDALWSFQVPAGTFTDVDSALTYTASLSDGVELPSWLDFDAATQTFSGTPPLHFSGELELKVSATDGTIPVSRTFKLSVTPVNDAPQGDDQTITLVENAVHTFSAADFTFSDIHDAPSDGFRSVIITSLPTNGTLALDEVAVTNGQTISLDFLSKLVFTPAPGASGNSYSSFTFRVQDDGGVANDGQDISRDYTFTFDIMKSAPSNQAPTASETISLTIDEGTATGHLSIGASDSNNDPLMYSIKEGQGPQYGSLFFNQDEGTFVYAPASDVYGTDTFTIVIDDSHGGVVEQNVTVRINSVNDAPISANSVQSLTPGASYTFSADDFAFFDNRDAPNPDSLKAVIISDLPASGVLTLDGVAVITGQSIDAALLSKLVFTADTDAVGSDYGSFGFIVQDTGGTARRGQDTSDEYTFVFNIKPVDAASHDDLIEAGDGNDTIYGGLGNDEMQGEGGSDVVIGGKDSGRLTWTDGKITSIVIGDNLYGNDGRDTYHFKQGDGVDMVWDFKPGEDVIDLTGYKVQGRAILEAPTSGFSKADVTVVFVRQVTEANERLYAGDYLKLAVILGDSSDAIIFNDFPSPSNNDVALVLSDGTLSSGDLLRLAQGNAIAEGSSGFSGFGPASDATKPSEAEASLVLTGNNEADTLIGASGEDLLYGNEGVNALNGKAGNDWIHGGNTQDAILGEDGDDVGYGNGGDDVVVGGSGSDKLYGAGGDDLIFGDDGEGLDLPTSWLAPTGRGISAKIEIVNSWWGGFEAKLMVTANESVAQWQLALLSRFKIESLWGSEKAGETSGDGGTLYTLGNTGSNANLANDQTTTIGFTARTNVAGVLSAAEILPFLSLSTDGVPAALPPLPAAEQFDTGINLAGGMVFENSADGTAVGTLSVVNADVAGAHSYQLLNNADGRFQLSSDGKTLQVVNGTLLDYEQSQTHTIVVRATNQRTGTYVDQTMTVVLLDVLNETTSGTAGNDVVVGGFGSDRLFGGGGSDVLNASAGRDVLNGGIGNDRLTGGAGLDTLTGGKGKDVFVFGNKETGNTKKMADYITDFSSKDKDRIDLRGIDADSRKKGDQNFSFIGTNAFTKAGQVRYEKTKKETYVYLNTDSDKAAEAVIKLKGAFDLQKGWFVL
jgi:VCBS repeat-containing protein